MDMTEKLTFQIDCYTPATLPMMRLVQPSSADGVVIKIGGKDETIPVMLRNTEGKIINCQIRGTANAKNLARYYLEGPIRVHGNGKWLRNAAGVWALESLLIQTWEELDTAPLDEVLAKIGKVAGNGWRAMDEPLLEWRKMRGLK